MGLLDFLIRLFTGLPAGEANPYAAPTAARPKARRQAGRLGVDDLCQRLRLTLADLQTISVRYSRFSIPKRSGGLRTIDAPSPPLKKLQRTILRRVLGRLTSHPAAMGFERGRSIVTNAAPHVGAAVVVRMDLHDFFPCTTAARVRDWFQGAGWNQEAAELLTRWCTHEGALPQGAPTSPRLSNLVNYALDVRLAALVGKFDGAYTRYADDITISFDKDDRRAGPIIGTIKIICADYGYRLHQKRKLIIRRRHQSQRVTGLVVNDKVALPREVRRRLRAVKHHLETGREATLTPEQMKGWEGMVKMVQLHGGGADQQ